MLKEEIFKNGLDFIQDKSIKEFVKFCINSFPDYFWESLASPSGKHHGGELLLDHVLGCVELGFKVCEQQSNWTQKQKDYLIASLILHDGWKCGDGLKKFSQEDYLHNKCVKNSIGMLKADNTHAEIGYKEILKLSEKFNKISKIDTSDYLKIANYVRYHMGPWTKTESDVKFDLSGSYDSVLIQVHNVDFFQSNMAKIRKRND